ncbi:MAG: N-acetylneuraminate synthase family protein [bacterium]
MPRRGFSGEKMKIRGAYIIAEVASAHEGDLKMLYTLIESAASAGADAIKFQLYHPDELAVKSYRYYDLYKKLQYSEEEWKGIINYSKKHNLDVWIDPYDRWGLALVTSVISDIKGVKVPPTILADMELTRGILGLGCMRMIGVSGFSTTQIEGFFKELGILKGSNDRGLFLMHGFQRYPTQIEDLNIERIKLLEDKFGLPVGYADHVDAGLQLAKIVPCLAIAAGAKIIEKHITLDRSRKGPDYYSSLNPDEFKEMVDLIKNTETAMGSGEVTTEEKTYLKDATKIVAGCAVQVGDIISQDKISYKRSDDQGLLPHEKGLVLGKIALKCLAEGESITAEDTKKPRIIALVAVRMKSTRLPKKALADIEGYTAIERLVNNLKPSQYIDEIVLATSTNEGDDPIEDLAKEKGLAFFRGHEDNVVKRFLDAARSFNTDIVVRATGDCPMLSHELADYLIESHLRSGADYTGFESNTVPVGTFSEVITASALERLGNTNMDLNYTEYLTYYFRNNPNLFSVNIAPPPNELYNRPGYRMTLDYIEDLEFFRRVYAHFKPGKEAIPLDKTIEFLDKHDEIVSINKDMCLKWRDDKDFVKKLNEITTIKNVGK